MKRSLACLASVALIAVVALLVGSCGSDSPATPGGNNATNVLFTAVKEAAPTFLPGAKSADKTINDKTINDQAMYVAYQLLRNYTYPDDEGVVDMSNIYKVLWETGRYLDEAPTRCAAVTEATDSALSPFAFDDFLGHSYALGMALEEGGYGTSIAYGVVGDERRMLASYKWAPDAAQQVAIGVIQAEHNATTGDASVRFAQAVRYPPGSTMGGVDGNGFAIRAKIDGNSTTHTFELKMAINGTSIVGKGISRGAGNWFLFRCGEAFYCIPADATEADLAAIVPTDLANVPAEGAAYKDAVAAAVPYDVATDLPAVDLSNFNGGVAGTPVSYLMY
jgi:hypothetical protein